MSFRVDETNDTIVIALQGRLAMHEAVELHGRLIALQDDARSVEIDVASCDALPTAVLQSFIAFNRARLAHGREPASVKREDVPLGVRLLHLVGRRSAERLVLELLSPRAV